MILESVPFLLDREGALVTTYRCQQPSPAQQALNSVVNTLAQFGFIVSYELYSIFFFFKNVS